MSLGLAALMNGSSHFTSVRASLYQLRDLIKEQMKSIKESTTPKES